MKVSMAQINPIIGDLKYNLELHINACAEAKDASSTLIIFPELSICGYPPEDLLTFPQFISDCKTTLNQLIEYSSHCPNLTIIVGVPLVDPVSGLFNAAVVFQNRQVISTYYKRCLPTYDVFDEHRYFTAGNKTGTVKIGNYNVGLSICEDIWQLSPHELVNQGCQLIINMSASPFEVGKLSNRISMFSKAAKFHQCDLIAVNQVGGNDDLIFDGSSMWINKNGLIKSLGISFKTDMIHRNIMTDFVSISPQFHAINQIENALILGIKDYVNKCGFKQVMLGLSGGIDSAITAVLAVEALGCENVFAYALPSEYSSDGSITDAYDLAKRLNIACETLPIHNINSTVNDSLSRVFTNYPKDHTEENIQSRIRGLLLMALSNKTGRLLLTTGNKSELAVGYCTLYGDMNGCLSVLGDITKTEVYELARWINTREYKIPQAIINKPPSAELKPNQKDTDSLPDYEILDEIIIEYVNNRLSSNEIIEKGYCKSTVEWTISAIRKNEYKRHQCPPTIKVSSTAFGSGRRVPIASNWTNSS